MTRIFISYNRVDKHITDELSNFLGKSYDGVWYDTAKLVGGDDWWEKILLEIDDCDHFIFLLSPESLNSEYCQKELEAAIRNEKHILPVRVRDRTQIPSNLHDKQCIDMFSKVTTEGLNEIYAAIIRNSKQPTSNNEQQYSSDLRLLDNLWPLISSPIIGKIKLGVYNAKVDKDEYMDYFWMYIFQRQKAENSFINFDLENTFLAMDNIMQRFQNSLHYQYKDQRIDNKVYLVLYQDERSGNRQHEVLEFLSELEYAHKSLVRAMKSIYPNYDFSKEEVRHKRIRELVDLRENLERHKNSYSKLFDKEPVDALEHFQLVTFLQHLCIDASDFDHECPEGCIEVSTVSDADINEFIRWDQSCRNNLLYIAHKRLTPNLVTREVNPLECRIWGEYADRNRSALNDAINRLNQLVREQKPLYSDAL